MWVSGFLFLPAGLSEALFVPVYWNPEVIWRYGFFDSESLFFAFFTGGIASVLYPAVFGYRIAPIKGTLRGLRLHLFWVFPAIAAVILVCIALFTDISVLHIAFAIFLIGILHMLLVRPDMFKASLWGALLFLLIYSGVLTVSILLFGESFIGAWNTEPFLGVSLFRIPLDEFLYAFLFGGLWSTVYCGVFNRQFKRRQSVL